MFPLTNGTLNEFFEKYPFLPLVFILLLATLTSLVFFNDRLGADACNYLDIGANLAQGKGYTATILTWFAEPSPIVHSALIEKQPLFPLFLAGFIYVFGMYRIILLKVLLFALFLGSLFLVYDVVRRYRGIKPAFFATLFLAVHPVLQLAQLDGGNYPLFIFLLMLSIYTYLRADKHIGAVLLGFLVGLVYLTRLEGLLVFLFFSGCYSVAKKWRHLVLLFLSFVLTISPLLVARQIKYGDFNKSTHSFQYRTLSTASEVMWFYEVELKTFKELFTQHKEQIFKQIRNNFKVYGQLFLGYKGFFIFPVLLIFLRPRYFQGGRDTHLLLLFFFWLVSLILRWPQTHIYDRSFLTAPLFFIFTPVYVIFLEDFFSDKLDWFLASKVKYAMPLAVLITIAINQVQARPFAVDLSKEYERIAANEQQLMRWIKKTVPIEWSICTDDYYLINYYTRRPTVTLPWNIVPENIDRFIKDYPVKIIIFKNNMASEGKISIREWNIRRTAASKNWPVFTIPQTTYQVTIPK